MLDYPHHRVSGNSGEARPPRPQRQLVFRYRRTTAAEATRHELQQLLPDPRLHVSGVFARFGTLRAKLRSDG
jgi:hypothetical protein